MKGAKAEPCEKKSKEPNRKRKITMGKSHHFFLSLRNMNISLKIANFCFHIVFGYAFIILSSD